MKQEGEILVVDDDLSVRRIITCLLEYGGYKVGAVEGGEAALRLLAQRQFDVVITDFSMPGMRGDQLVARIRQQLPTQRIIMVTAFADDHTILGLPFGSVDALLPKPFSLEELHQTLERVLTGESAAPAIPTGHQNSVQMMRRPGDAGDDFLAGL